MAEGPDKTRIKSSKFKDGGSENIDPLAKDSIEDEPTRLNQDPDDKTRIAQHSLESQEKSENDNKTRVAQNRAQSSQFDESATRIKPRSSGKVDKTRLKPVHKDDEFPARLEDTDGEAPASHLLKNRFVLEEVLGAGGMGVVYKAKDLLKVEAQDRDPYVAIKVLSEEFKTHPEAFISLQRESRKSQRIAHPNIVNVFDFDRDGDTVFMTMEYLDGSPLDDLINQYQSTGLPTDDAWEIIRGMSSALVHAHAEHIIHSDFKPGNVFVTKKGIAKVFDFGIARAVAQVEQFDDNPDDKTVFDAGNLGALTPAYASLEMLQGDEPDVRDDIYALGCVAYEMFTGHHPFNKVPADEAERQGLKPKRIQHIKKYQWRAIEKAIAFHRQDRMETVSQFLAEISPKINPLNNWLLILVILLITGGIGYYVYVDQTNNTSQISEFDIRNELELTVRIDFYKGNIKSQVEQAVFSESWEDSIWKDMSDLIQLMQDEDPWIAEYKGIIFNLYLEKINSMIAAQAFDSAESLIVNARRYSDETEQLDGYLQAITQAKEQQVLKQKLAAEKRQQQKQAALQKQLQQAQLKQQQQKKITQKNEQKKQFDIALDNLNNQLLCQGNLNMRNFSTAIKKLKSLDNNRYVKLEPRIIASLGACITSIGKLFPDRAMLVKQQGLGLFPANASLMEISIKPRDPCDISLAGLGARGKRTICKDKLKASGHGPELVVIPANNGMKAFAIGKYELTVAEWNKYCNSSSRCDPEINLNGELPVSGITIKLVRGYLKWLSDQTGHKYRLPSAQEWLYAARSRRKSLDPNRNCQLSTRGFEKGGELINSRIGKQNSWGLVNYVGNVQEWVYDSGRKLVAVGGSYREAMESCDIETLHVHAGDGDQITGLRVLRELGG